jgi:hypothetical protein
MQIGLHDLVSNTGGVRAKTLTQMTGMPISITRMQHSIGCQYQARWILPAVALLHGAYAFYGGTTASAGYCCTAVRNKARQRCPDIPKSLWVFLSLDVLVPATNLVGVGAGFRGLDCSA